MLSAENTDVSPKHFGCRSVKVACRSGGYPTLLPFLMPVSPGKIIYKDCVVKNCSPTPCVLLPTTEVTVVDYVDVHLEELEHNYMLRIQYYSESGAGKTEFYVYPKSVWEKVEKVVSPLLEDKPPRNPGVIFIGAPGTGKTSLIRILPDYLGLSVVEVGVENVMSKWVGESEKRLDAFFSHAELIQPTVMVVDEGDWILSPVRDSGGYGDVGQKLLGILKRKLSDYYKHGAKIIMLFSANLHESAIDASLKREGRCGKPIVIPLPDYEAVYSYLTRASGIEEKKAEEIAIDAVNAGLSMSDVVQIANMYKETGKYSIEPMRYRGYRRHQVRAQLLEDREIRDFLDAIEKAYAFTKMSSYRYARVWIRDLPSSIALPIVSSMIGLVAKKPVVLIDYEKYLEEAVDMINLLKATAVITHEYMHPEMLKVLYKNADFPIIFIGNKSAPEVEVHRINLKDFVVNQKFRGAVISIMSSVYGLDIDQSVLKSLKMETAERFVDSLTDLVLSGRTVYSGLKLS